MFNFREALETVRYAPLVKEIQDFRKELQRTLNLDRDALRALAEKVDEIEDDSYPMNAYYVRHEFNWVIDLRSADSQLEEDEDSEEESDFDIEDYYDF